MNKFVNFFIFCGVKVKERINKKKAILLIVEPPFELNSKKFCLGLEFCRV